MEGVLINDLLPLKQVQYFAQLLYSDKKVYILVQFYYFLFLVSTGEKSDIKVYSMMSFIQRWQMDPNFTSSVQ
jgi:hypothetical protein